MAYEKGQGVSFTITSKLISMAVVRAREEAVWDEMVWDFMGERGACFWVVS